MRSPFHDRDGYLSPGPPDDDLGPRARAGLRDRQGRRRQDDRRARPRARAAARAGRRAIVVRGRRPGRGAAALDARAGRPGPRSSSPTGCGRIPSTRTRALEEWAARSSARAALVGILARSNAFSAFVDAAPGARELVTITKAWELGRRERWDRGRRPLRPRRRRRARPPGTGSACCAPRARSPTSPASGRSPRRRGQVADLLRDPVPHARSWPSPLAGELPVSETLELEGRARGRARPRPRRDRRQRVLPQRFARADVARRRGPRRRAGGRGRAARPRGPHHELAAAQARSCAACAGRPARRSRRCPSSPARAGTPTTSSTSPRTWPGAWTGRPSRAGGGALSRSRAGRAARRRRASRAARAPTGRGARGRRARARARGARPCRSP